MPKLVPVSSVLKIHNTSDSETAKECEQVSSLVPAIDAVHCCLDRSLVIAGFADQSYKKYRERYVLADADGTYVAGMNTPEITIYPHAEHHGYVFLHEFGHYLDHWSLCERDGFASERCRETSSPLKQWYTAVTKTKHFQQLRSLRDSLDVKSDDHKQMSLYFLSAKELFACSYSQYMSATLAIPDLLDGLNYYRQPRKYLTASTRFGIQWETDDFSVVSVTMKQVLAQLPPAPPTLAVL